MTAPTRCASAGDLGDRLNDSDLVVDQHDADDRDVVADRRCRLVEIDQSVAADAENRQRRAQAFEMAGGIEYAGVLGRDGDDAAARLAGRGQRPRQREVRRLGGAAGEDQRLRRRADQPRHLRASRLDRGVSLETVAVRRVRIAESFLKIRLHRLARLGAERCRRLIIEIDRTLHAAARRAASVRQTAMKPSTSASVVFQPRLMRIDSLAPSTPIAVSTWLTDTLPDEHAAPALTR